MFINENVNPGPGEELAFRLPTVGPGDDRARTTPVVHGCQLTAIKKRASWRQRRAPSGPHVNVWERPRHYQASPPSVASSFFNPVECVRQCPEVFLFYRKESFYNPRKSTQC